jgi:type I restriction enzyme M protein
MALDVGQTPPDTVGVTATEREVIRNHAAFIWSVADLLRGDYKQSEYGKVILPLTVLRRFDCVLEPTKEAVLAKYQEISGRIQTIEPILQQVAGQQFFNTSPLTFQRLLDDPPNIADNLRTYIGACPTQRRAQRLALGTFDLAGLNHDQLR